MLTQGSPAPDFTLYTNKMEAFTLSEHQGKQHVLLLFFPGAFTGVCTTELNTINNDLDAYGGDDTQVVGISTDSPFTLQEFANVNRFEFPLLSDHDAKVCATYGAKYNHDFTQMKLDRISRRAAFVVDKEGVVQYAEVLESAGDLPNFDAIKGVLGSL